MLLDCVKDNVCIKFTDIFSDQGPGLPRCIVIKLSCRHISILDLAWLAPGKKSGIHKVAKQNRISKVSSLVSFFQINGYILLNI
jgi:hypothetical protein